MNEELKKLEELLANDRKIIEDNYKEIERLEKIIEDYRAKEIIDFTHKLDESWYKEDYEKLNHRINTAIEYVEESYNVTVEGIEGIAKFFSKRNETLLKILKGEIK